MIGIIISIDGTIPTFEKQSFGGQATDTSVSARKGVSPDEPQPERIGFHLYWGIDDTRQNHSFLPLKNLTGDEFEFLHAICYLTPMNKLSLQLAIALLIALFSPSLSHGKEPIPSTKELATLSDRDLRVAALLHRIYDSSLKDREARARLKEGEQLNTVEALHATNVKLAIEGLSTLVDMKALEESFAKKSKAFEQSKIGRKHPERDWVDTLHAALQSRAD